MSAKNIKFTALRSGLIMTAKGLKALAILPPKQIIDKQLQDKPNKANPPNQPLDFGRVFSDQIKPRPKDHGINQK